MELFSSETIWGLCFFLAGIITLNKCSSLDQKNHYKIRELRRLEWFGRREADSKATRPFNILGSVMTCAGAVFSIYGLFLFFKSVL